MTRPNIGAGISFGAWAPTMTKMEYGGGLWKTVRGCATVGQVISGDAGITRHEIIAPIDESRMNAVTTSRTECGEYRVSYDGCVARAGPARERKSAPAPRQTHRPDCNGRDGGQYLVAGAELHDPAAEGRRPTRGESDRAEDQWRDDKPSSKPEHELIDFTLARDSAVDKCD